MLLKRGTGKGKINKKNKTKFGNEVADRIRVKVKFFPSFFFVVVVVFIFRARFPFPVPFLVIGNLRWRRFRGDGNFNRT